MSLIMALLLQLLLLTMTACNSLSKAEEIIFSKSSRAQQPQSLPLLLTLTLFRNPLITLQA
jgi:hypothetical protein